MDKVLIIDDDRELCALMKKCIEQEGFSASVACGGFAGLRLLDENKENCSLVILDVMMPDMDGFRVLQKIREKSNVPVLMLTAKSDEDDKVSGLRLGAEASSGCSRWQRSALRRYAGGLFRKDQRRKRHCLT